MKKLFITLVLACATLPAMAQHWHGHGFRHHRHYTGGSWVAPLIIGGVVGAAIANSRDTLVVQPQPPVVLQNPPVYVQRQTVCTEWTETYSSDGTITRTRTCTQ